MKHIKTYILALFAFLGMVSCESNFLDVNDDPNSPKTAELSKLLTESEYNLGVAFGTGSGASFISKSLSGATHYLVLREVPTYSMSPGDNGILNSWNNVNRYVIPNLEAIITEAELKDYLIYAGVAKVQKVYTYSMMVDLWGDIPFTEANILGVNTPKPDKAKDIYNALLVLLDDAVANLSSTTSKNILKPGADDLFYGGNKDKWIRLANTLKLKLLMQTRLVKADITNWSTQLSSLMATNNFMAAGDDFEFWHTANKTPTDERHPAYLAEYSGGQTTFYSSPWLYEIMKGYTQYNAPNNPMASITDPRIPYYFYNQLTASAKAEAKFDYRDGAFLSNFFGSTSGSSSMDKSLTKLGIYPCGGKYDNGAGGAVGSSVGTGVAPVKLITYSALRFMLAEMALMGEISGDPRTYLEEGVRASIAHVNKVVGRAKGTATVPDISATATTTFTNAVLAKYDAAASTDKKLEIVLTQKWIAGFLSPVDPYTDYRRTGYPIWFNPLTTTPMNTGWSPTANKPGEDGVPVVGPAAVTVVLPYKYQKSLYYQDAEVSRNPNMVQKTDPSTARLFWDTRTYDY